MSKLMQNYWHRILITGTNTYPTRAEQITTLAIVISILLAAAFAPEISRWVRQ